MTDDRQMTLPLVHHGNEIRPGTIVRGNWSSIEYRADHVWQVKDKGYWCINGKAVNNPRQSGSFSMLGERVGDEITITDPSRPKDRLIIIKEPSRKRLMKNT